MAEHTISRRRVLQCGAVLAAAALTGCGARQTGTSADSSAQFATSGEQENAAPRKLTYKAMWISYLDWALADFSTADTFRASAQQMLDNCTALGLNTVIAQVRPFGDAMYPSRLFPWSHLCTGTQGQDPGYDPLDILVEEAHTRGLSLEAWINPYRLRLNETMPAALAADNLANTHPDWCVEANGGLYLNPAIAEAADYVVQGVSELLENYAVDGVHFDDYFYPTTDESIDAAQYAAAGTSLALADWRRANVTGLVRAVRDAIRAVDPALRFGISPQGNPENNYDGQYSDVSAWIAPAEGEPLVDYICPQLYWGYHYTLKSGSDRFAFENISAEWVATPRAEGVALYFGLGAYRIGDGDGGQNEDSASQWNSGHALADQIATTASSGADGYILFRYASLYASAYPELAAAECAAIAGENAGQAQ